MNTRPAPACRAARAASSAAPLMWLRGVDSPPITATSPKLPLWLVWASDERAARCARFVPISRAQGATSAGRKTPRSSNQTSPVASRPWAVKSPGFSVNKLKQKMLLAQVERAQDAIKVVSPVSASSPVGTSTDSRAAALDCINASHSVISRLPALARSSRAPIPSSASMQKSKAGGGSLAICTPAASARARAASASGGALVLWSGRPVQVTTTFFPHRCRCNAASKPSPPLLPGPQATQMSSACGASASVSRATDKPARCISVCAGKPVAARCSICRVAATLKSGWLVALEIRCMVDCDTGGPPAALKG